MAINNSAPTPQGHVAGDLPRHDPPGPGRPPQERDPLRPGDRGGRARGLRRGAGRGPGRHGLHRRAVAVRQPAPGGRGAAHGHRGVGARDPSGLRPGVAGPRGGDGARAWRSSACGPWGRWWPSSTARRCRTRRRSPGRCAARCCRPPGDRRAAGPRRPRRHGGRQARPRGGRGGRAPPDAQRPAGGRQDQPGRAAADDPARPHHRAGARGDRAALAGRAAARRRRAGAPAALLRAPPRREQGQRGGRRHRTGPARRDQPGPPRGALPRRVPAVPRRRRRRVAPAPGER